MEEELRRLLQRHGVSAVELSLQKVKEEEEFVAAWEELPATAVQRIALFGGIWGLQFCAACKAYRAAQPPLRVLIVNRDDNKKFRAETSNKDDFCCIIKKHSTSKPTIRTHRLLESIHPRYAKEITNLYATAIHEYDHNTKRPEALLTNSLEAYGASFTALKALHIWHPYLHHHNCRPTDLDLHHCLTQLIRATKPTLRNLGIGGGAKDFSSQKCTPLFNDIGLEKLHQLRIIIALHPLGSSGQETETRRLQVLAKKCCPNLIEEAHIVCHKYLPPWIYKDCGCPCDWDDRISRANFLRIHQGCLQPDESSAPPISIEEKWERPNGFSGKWCGNYNFCACSSTDSDNDNEGGDD